MSRLPSRLETNSSPRLPGSQTGPVLSAAASVSCTGAPPAADTSQIELGAMLPRLVRVPSGDSPDANAGFPEVNAIQRPSGDQASEWAAGRAEIRRDGPSS